MNHQEYDSIHEKDTLFILVNKLIFRLTSRSVLKYVNSSKYLFDTEWSLLEYLSTAISYCISTGVTKCISGHLGVSYLKPRLPIEWIHQQANLILLLIYIRHLSVSKPTTIVWVRDRSSHHYSSLYSRDKERGWKLIKSNII